MVIVMHQSVNTEAALLYNELKVEKGKASFFHHRNTNSIDPFSNPIDFRLDTLRKIEAFNKRTQNKCFHISFNPGPEDMKRMSENDLKKEMDRFIKQMGYGEQPYFVYHHKDIDREHFHLVSTRIDAHNFKKIKDNNEKRRVNAFVNNLEESYNLSHASHVSKSIVSLPDDKTPHLYHRIQKTFVLLNQSNISSKEQYVDVLKGFNIELRNSERGQSVLVIDQNGETQRHPVPLSDLKVQPEFALKSELTELEDGTILRHKSEIESLLKALNKEYRFYTKSELKSALFRNDYVLFQNSENNNLTVFSMKDKAVIDSQYLLKKYRSRLKDFVLTSDDFYCLIRDCGKRIFPQNNAENLNQMTKAIDGNKSKIKELKRAVNELDLQQIDSFKEKIINLNKDQSSFIERAVRTHLNFLLDKAEEKSLDQNSSEFRVTQKSYIERVKNQFIWELLNEMGKREWSNKNKYKNDQKRKKHRKRRF